MKTEIKPLVLESGDCLDLQRQLCRSFAQVLKFDGHTLYFPVNGAVESPKLVAKERKVLVPLLYNGRQLGVLVLHNIDVKQVRTLLPYLPAMTTLVLEGLARIRSQERDAETGLYVPEFLYQRLCEESALVRDPKTLQPHFSTTSEYRLCHGLIVLRLVNGEELSLRVGFGVVSGLLAQLAQELTRHLTADMLAVRLGNYDFGVLFHSSGREQCYSEAEELLSALKKVPFRHPVTGQPVYPVLSAGAIFYPHDLHATETQLPMEEQARLLVNRVSLACEIASPGHSLGYAQILRLGGRILELLPFGRLRINLGRQAGVRPGATFAIYGVGAAHTYKGDLVLVAVRRKDATAELIHQEQVQLLPEAGDVLELVRDRPKGGEVESSAEDFYALMRPRALAAECSTLVMIHVEAAAQINRVKEAWQEAFSAAETLQGQHGAHILLFFHPEKKAEELLDAYVALATKLSSEQCDCACGLASFPFLSYGRADLEELGLKALEYSMLLPAPRVGICNSLALTMSADRRYSQGDLFGALEEYKQALLADANNGMAWNSMGVCMAALGRGEEARRHFLEALERNPESTGAAQLYYNLGTVCQGLGEMAQAQEYLQSCVEKDPTHLYGWIRLGELLEREGDEARARQMYTQGVNLEEQGPTSGNLGRRHLALLAQRRGANDEARSLLLECLQKNPYDSQSMLLLADIYLQSGEDPSIAELLCKKSLALEERVLGWGILAKALKSLGREEDCKRALLRAQALREQNAGTWH